MESLWDWYHDEKFYADNNFKSGYLRALETALETKLPACGIKEKPHIKFHIKTLKMKFRTIHEMLTGPSCSCFGWDLEKQNHTLNFTCFICFFYCCCCRSLLFSAIISLAILLFYLLFDAIMPIGYYRFTCCFCYYTCWSLFCFTIYIVLPAGLLAIWCCYTC